MGVIEPRHLNEVLYGDKGAQAYHASRPAPPHPRVERNCPGLQTEQLVPTRPQGDIFMAALLFVMIESPEVYSDGSG